VTLEVGWVLMDVTLGKAAAGVEVDGVDIVMTRNDAENG
jgi:hypothetical protein